MNPGLTHELRTSLKTTQGTVRNLVLGVVSDCFCKLFAGADYDSTLEALLKGVGDAVGLSRISAILQGPESNGQPYHEVAYQWEQSQEVRRGVSRVQNRQIDPVLMTLLRAGTPDWRSSSKSEGPLPGPFEWDGALATAIVPVRVAGNYLGALRFDDIEERREWSADEQSALLLSASAFGGMIHRRELERSNERASRESKQIAKFLDESLTLLSGPMAHSTPVEAIIHALGNELHAWVVFLFRFDSSTRHLRLVLTCRDGVLRHGMSGDELTLWSRPFPCDITPAWEIMCRAGGLFTPDMSPIPPEEFAWPGTFEWGEREEISDMGMVVLNVGGQPIGSIGFALKGGRRLTPSDKRFVDALAKQAAVAIAVADFAEQIHAAELSRERMRMAREIHDTLAQGFTGILMQLGAAAQVPGERRQDIAPHLETIAALARASLAEARRSVRTLRLPPEEPPLDQLISEAAEFFRRQSSSEITVSICGEAALVPPAFVPELHRICQEALQNAVKHASAQTIQVTLDIESDGVVRLSVRDDGVGFDTTLDTPPDHFGLVGMQERAAAIDASLTIVSEKGLGTEVIVQCFPSPRRGD